MGGGMPTPLDGISPCPIQVHRLSPRFKAYLGSVRSFLCSGSHFGIKYQTQDVAQDYGEYFWALRNTHSLTLSKIRVGHANEVSYFSTFTTSFRAFVVLVDCVPSIETLQLDPFVRGPNERPILV